MADKNGKTGGNGSTKTSVGQAALSAANNNMPNSNNNSNAKISNGPGMAERASVGVERATSEARTSQISLVMGSIIHIYIYKMYILERQPSLMCVCMNVYLYVCMYE